MSYAGKAQALRNMGKTAEMLTTIEAGLKVVPGDNNLEKLYAIHYLKEGQNFSRLAIRPKQKRLIKVF